ncbi:MAG: hypothetical protein HPY69_00120 [Armatimonadetes bacterium]|nr:hypothetical protein [Armatimonadota bacterium]
MHHLTDSAGQLALLDATGQKVLGAVLLCDTAEAQGPVPMTGGDDGVWRGRQGSVLLEVRETGTGTDFTELSLLVVPHQAVRVERVGLRLTMGVGGRPLLAKDAQLVALGESLGAARRVTELGQLLDAGEGRVTLHAIGALLKGAAQALLVGIGGVTPDFPAITADGETVEIVLEVGHSVCQPVEYRLVIGLSTDPFALLESYGDLLARNGRRVGDIPTGWNSWDYYQGAVTMDDIRAEMAAINASPLRGKLRYLTIDMGWENSWGDWRPNRKFPPDYAAIADEIRAAGFEPGIWLAPLQASTYLPAARHDREMFCRGADGEPIIAPGRTSYLLFDPTHPRTEEWLHGLCCELRQSGFSLFKIDYIYRNYLDMIPQFHRPEVGRAAAARRFLEIIRNAIGDDAHLLSCGVPLPAAFGLADSARISTDIHNFWGHIRNSALQLSVAYWLGGRVWINDPDFALIRSPQTTDDPYLNVPYQRTPYTGEGFWMAGDDASFEELKTWLTLVHLCGGSLFASDSMPRLNQLGWHTLQRLYVEPSPPARPLDLFESAPPRLWLAEGRLGVINYADEPAEIPLPGNTPSRVTDFWTGESLVLEAAVVLPPHGSLLLKV